MIGTKKLTQEEPKLKKRTLGTVKALWWSLFSTIKDGTSATQIRLDHPLQQPPREHLYNEIRLFRMKNIVNVFTSDIVPSVFLKTTYRW
jgi:hypothetical protein